MDRRIQLTALALLVPVLSWAQCDPTQIKKLEVDGCLVVQMSPVMFTKYWTIEQKLKEVRKEAKVIRVKHDSLQALNKATIKSLSDEKDLWKESYVIADNRALKLKEKNKKLHSRWAIITAISVVLTTVLCN